KGDVLAEVDTVELSAQLEAARATTAAAGAAARRARVDLTAARRELARANELAKKGIIAEQEVEARRSAVDAAVAAVRVAEAQGVEADANADVLERRVAESTIKAPFAGVVAQRSVDPGAYVSVGSPVVRLVARAPLRVSFEVASEAVEELRAAGGVDVRSATTGERQFHARLTGVAGEVRRERRVVAAEGVVEDPPPAWLPGMFCEVLLAKRSVSDAPLVASSALVTRADAETGDMRTGVFVADGDSARWVPAAVLARDGDRLALDAGGALPEGARVLVSGHTDLADGAPIKLTADVFADDGGDGAAPREASP
ncbi:MAG: efflux RND transporter periplasmic adaptor subunit, partial [Myxococcales bacterium]|nr:efflux RND transporter periplasmic adaptor subunit [Myxococcales bacterium]